MKLAAFLILVLAGVAVAAPVDTSNLDGILTHAKGVMDDQRQMEDQLADANRKLRQVDAAWQKAIAEEKAAGKKALDAEKANTAAVQKKLDWYWHNPWVNAALWVRRTVYWTLGIGAGLYLLAIVTGFGNPLGTAFSVSQFLVRLLPFGNIVRIFNPARVTVPVAAVKSS